MCVRGVPKHVGVAVAVIRRAGAAAPLPLLESVVPGDVEVAGTHEAALPGREAAPVEALEGRLRGRPHEEGVAGHEVDGRDVEAHGLHHVPRQLPEREPHEPQRLRRQQAQPAPQLAPHLRRRLGVDGGLLPLQRAQLLGVVVAGRGRRRQHAPDRLRDLVWAEEDGVGEDDDDPGLVERRGEPAPALRAARNVDAERRVLGPGHDALGVGPQRGARRLHLRRPRHLHGLLQRHARLHGPPRHGRRRRREPVDEAAEQLVADGEGGEAMVRERDGHGGVAGGDRARAQECERGAVLHRRQGLPRRADGRRRLGHGRGTGGRVLGCPYAPSNGSAERHFSLGGTRFPG
uniref:Uncharacterized protein n=1 Tax=Hordeum vulgare subsp. vulgare TaxID=112509 RepID=A0A8I6X3M3_HORVV